MIIKKTPIVFPVNYEIDVGLWLGDIPKEAGYISKQIFSFFFAQTSLFYDSIMREGPPPFSVL